jgi:hypothetical protein
LGKVEFAGTREGQPVSARIPVQQLLFGNFHAQQNNQRFDLLQQKSSIIF